MHLPQLLQYTHAVVNFVFDRSLAPYDLNSYSRWQALSSHITRGVVTKLQPVGGNICVLAETLPRTGGRLTPAEQALNAQLHSSQSAIDRLQGPEKGEDPRAAPHAGRCFYTAVERLVKRSGSDAAQRTAANLDRSEELATIVSRDCSNDPRMLIGNRLMKEFGIDESSWCMLFEHACSHEFATLSRCLLQVNFSLHFLRS